MAGSMASSTPLRVLALALGLLLCASVDGKLITGLTPNLVPCPKGVPPARECLVSVLVDLRALRARARERANATQPQLQVPVQLQPLQPLEPPQELPATDLRRQYEEEQQQQQQQRNKQVQLEQAVRFQEDELQQLREQVQELRLQLARALQLYQLTAGAPRQHAVKSPLLSLRGSSYYQPPPRPAPDQREEDSGRRFYRTLRPPPWSAPASSLSYLHQGGLREVARGEVVVAT